MLQKQLAGVPSDQQAAAVQAALAVQQQIAAALAANAAGLNFPAGLGASSASGCVGGVAQQSPTMSNAAILGGSLGKCSIATCATTASTFSTNLSPLQRDALRRDKTLLKQHLRQRVLHKYGSLSVDSVLPSTTAIVLDSNQISPWTGGVLGDAGGMPIGGGHNVEQNTGPPGESSGVGDIAMDTSPSHRRPGACSFCGAEVGAPSNSMGPPMICSSCSIKAANTFGFQMLGGFPRVPLLTLNSTAKPSTGAGSVDGASSTAAPPTTLPVSMAGMLRASRFLDISAATNLFIPSPIQEERSQPTTDFQTGFLSSFFLFISAYFLLYLDFPLFSIFSLFISHFSPHSPLTLFLTFKRNRGINLITSFFSHFYFSFVRFLSLGKSLLIPPNSCCQVVEFTNSLREWNLRNVPFSFLPCGS